MSKSDQWVNILLIGSIIIYLSIWAVGHFTHKFAFLASILNMLTGAAILLYWFVRQLQIAQHTIEGRELLLLLFEVVVIACAVYYLLNNQRANGLKITQLVFYGIHLSVFVLGLLFMMTFKMNRLI